VHVAAAQLRAGAVRANLPTVRHFFNEILQNIE
jgi:hypothetical protein